MKDFKQLFDKDEGLTTEIRELLKEKRNTIN